MVPRKGPFCFEVIKRPHSGFDVYKDISSFSRDNHHTKQIDKRSMRPSIQHFLGRNEQNRLPQVSQTRSIFNMSTFYTFVYQGHDGSIAKTPLCPLAFVCDHGLGNGLRWGQHCERADQNPRHQLEEGGWALQRVQIETVQVYQLLRIRLQQARHWDPKIQRLGVKIFNSQKLLSLCT